MSRLIVLAALAFVVAFATSFVMSLVVTAVTR